jgi:replicative DNA helicase
MSARDDGNAPGAVLADVGAERALLASASRGTPEQIANMLVAVKEDLFFLPLHMLAWRVIRENLEQAIPWDWTIFKAKLRKLDVAESDAESLADEMGRNVPGAGMWRHYADLVEDYYVRRGIDLICREGLKLVHDKKEKAQVHLSDIEGRCFELHANRGRGEMKHVSAFAVEALENFKESAKRKGKVSGGIATGFTDIDRLNIKGIRNKHLWCFGAPPGGGKTLFLMKLLYNIASGAHDYTAVKSEWDQEPIPVALFSLEMDGAELAERELVRLSRVNLNTLQRGMENREQLEQLGAAALSLKQPRLFIEPTFNISVQDLRIRARYAVAKHGVRAIGVDYAQLLFSDTRGAKLNKTTGQEEVSRGLKQLAQELGIPVLVLVQVQREAFKGRPHLGNIADSAQYCKDADVVAMLSPWDSKYAGGDEDGGSFPDDESDDVLGENDDMNFLALDFVKTRGFGGTSGKAPLKIRWDREFYDLRSTCDRLFDPQGKNVQR